MSSDPTDPLQAVRRENRLLRERVADLERQLKRSDDAAPVLDATLSVREALLSEAEHIAHMGSWVWDVPTNSVYWTDELFRILGYDPQRDAASTERFFE